MDQEVKRSPAVEPPPIPPNGAILGSPKSTAGGIAAIIMGIVILIGLWQQGKLADPNALAMPIGLIAAGLAGVAAKDHGK